MHQQSRQFVNKGEGCVLRAGKNNKKPKRGGKTWQVGKKSSKLESTLFEEEKLRGWKKRDKKRIREEKKKRQTVEGGSNGKVSKCETN